MACETAGGTGVGAGGHEEPVAPVAGGLQLGHGKRKLLEAVVAEVDLHAHVLSLSFQVDDDAGAELRMGDVLPDAEAADIA